MALRQPCAYRADLWRRDAGGGSPLSPVSGADPERPAQAISCVVCPVLSRLLNHVRCKGTEPWSATTVWLLLLTAMLPHTLRGLLDVWGVTHPSFCASTSVRAHPVHTPLVDPVVIRYTWAER